MSFIIDEHLSDEEDDLFLLPDNAAGIEMSSTSRSNTSISSMGGTPSKSRRRHGGGRGESLAEDDPFLFNLDLPLSEAIISGAEDLIRSNPDGTVVSPDGDEDYYFNALDVPPRPQRDLLVFPILLAALMLIFVSIVDGIRRFMAFLLAFVIGAVLVYSQFGFSSYFRRIFTDVRFGGFRLQMIMLGISSFLFALLISPDAEHGPQPKLGNPGVSVVFGSFLFGIGQQIADGCGSGTLVGAAKGQLRSMNALFWFIIGTGIGAYHWGWWMRLPNSPGDTLLRSWSPVGALFFQLTLFGLFVVGSLGFENWYHGDKFFNFRRKVRVFRPNEPTTQDHDLIGYRRSTMQRILYGPWPKLAGGIGLGVLSALVLVTIDKPWGITTAYSQWGSSIFAGLGAAPETWAYWQQEELKGMLFESPLRNVGSIMNIGVFLGATFASMMSGSFVQDKAEYYQCNTMGNVKGYMVYFGATLGGLLMGYGSRIAFGCNIGAYFSGISSYSIHGWVWILCNLPGQYMGTMLRPWFSLPVEYKPYKVVQLGSN